LFGHDLFSAFPEQENYCDTKMIYVFITFTVIYQILNPLSHMYIFVSTSAFEGESDCSRIMNAAVEPAFFHHQVNFVPRSSAHISNYPSISEAAKLT
jgi:hypothetical protein